jgi:membrane protein DedA with SNARE-associated domain
MDLLRPHLDYLANHLYAVVFTAFLVEAAGMPFPSRLVLIVAATLSEGRESFAALVLVSAMAAVIGDHVPYVAGKLMGPRLLTLYCRLTLGSERCVEKTVRYFVRFGAAAIVLSRFSASVRIFASALSGCGHITYGRFLICDIVGSLAYATLWVGVGRIVGEQVADFLKRSGSGRLLLLIAPAAFVGLLAYRLWRRFRYGPARASSLTLDACDTNSEDTVPATPPPRARTAR